MSQDARTLLARQLKLRLELLRAAGVEFLPTAAPLALTPAPAPLPARDAIKQGVPVAVPDTPAIAVPAVTGLFDEADAPLPDSPDGRRRELTVLAERVSGCARCPQLFSTRTQTVFGVGPIDPDVCFVGEAPGADEDATGEPFVGRAGQLLNRIIDACGLRREEVYICNTLKCLLPNNRTPTPDERSHCREYSDRHLGLVRPKYLVALGATAAQNLLSTTAGIGKLRGKIHKYRDIPVVCTFHPAALLR